MKLESIFMIKSSLLNNKISKRFDAELSILGISFTEYLIMYHLKNSSSNTMRRIDLAELMNMSPSGITRLLAPMEKLKLIEKVANPRDARQSLVKLSMAGQTKFKDATVSFDHRATEMLKQLDDKEIQQLDGLLNKIQ